MNEKHVSVTQKNTYVDKIATIIQTSRLLIKQDNKEVYFTSNEIRKIILLLYLCIECKIEIKKSDELSLSDILLALDKFCPKSFICCDKIVNLKKTYDKICEIKEVFMHEEYLKYAIEVLEYEPEAFLSMPIKRGVHVGNEIKKNSGIYYTPVDVVGFMIDKCINSLNCEDTKRNLTYLDCSCGSGIFLLSIIDKFIDGGRDERKILEFISNSIWGIDKSGIAVETCKVVILTEILKRIRDFSYVNELWKILGENIVCGDSLDMENVLSKNKKFPRKFSCIIGNPPYVTVSGKGNIFISFVNNLIDYSDGNSCSSLIVPLSICYSQVVGFVNLRQRIFDEQDVAWEFYNYDRSPDSLFGDQVKTRNTILFRASNVGKKVFYTTGLQRWTSENRDGLFSNIKQVQFSSCGLSIIPKIATEIERIAFEKLSTGKNSISQLCVKHNSSCSVAVNGTAYNWLCAYAQIPPSTDEFGKPYIPNSMKMFNFLNDKDKYFFVALLCNRVTYWYWSVIGDGFHVNTSLLNDFKIGKDDFDDTSFNRLSEIGKMYSERLVRYPVKSYNSKKCIINYNHLECREYFSETEKMIIRNMGIPSEFEVYIEEWYNSQILCGR